MTEHETNPHDILLHLEIEHNVAETPATVGEADAMHVELHDKR